MSTILDAKRYIDNAREILREKARKEDRFYQDTKYVKLAGHAAYTGILVALDGFLGKKTKGRIDVDWYKSQLAKLDKKVLNTFVSAYDILHLSMAYDGNPNVNVAKEGLDNAETLIKWVESKIASA
ncbi:DUF5618 family protein [Larkinella rosea]|uniref:DUF5618 domain-containing protein n=1 Tax=Larkinella rosea TaxID=2025312 RepID=A0A3P1BP29_9BACT|nr:DUF5618 family protein [Larkinella rosea]RRB02673.1 hypothetical protein EHT25_19700 [Larkinella rosea]